LIIHITHLYIYFYIIFAVNGCRPTFKFYKNGKEIANLVGANPGGLKSLVDQHAGTPEESGSNSLNVQGHVSEVKSCFSAFSFFNIIFVIATTNCGYEISVGYQRIYYSKPS
jgi:hypothetical protein